MEPLVFRKVYPIVPEKFNGILLLGDFPRAEWLPDRLPLGGWELTYMTDWCAKAGIDINECAIGNVLLTKPPREDVKNYFMKKRERATYIKENPDALWYKDTFGGEGWLRPERLFDIHYLHKFIEMLQPNIIVAMGALALWSVTGVHKIGQYRGNVIESHFGGKVLPTFHPSSVIKQYTNRMAVGTDLIKVKAESAFPEFRRTKRQVLLEPTYEDIDEYLGWIEASNQRAAFDIETARGQITCIGFAGSDSDAIVIPFILDNWENYWSLEDEVRVVARIKQFLENDTIIKIAQNNLYDVLWLKTKLNIEVRGKIEDTMHMHHAMQPEMRKGLDYLASIYTNDPPWKNMAKHKGNKRDE